MMRHEMLRMNRGGGQHALTLKYILVLTDFQRDFSAAAEYGIALASGFGAWL
jgi:hypothetical protein